MQRSLALLAFTVLILGSSTEARRLWQFPGFGSSATSPPAGGMAGAGGAGAAPVMPGLGGAGTAPSTGAAGAGGAGAAGAAGAGDDVVNQAVAEAVAAATSDLNAAGVATAPQPTAATANPTAATAQPTIATASATGTPGRPGAATAVADDTRGVAADATGASTATAAAGGEAVTTAGEEEEPAAPAGPKVLRPGVYVIADPPPPPKPKPAATGALAYGNATGVAAGRNVTAGPPMPTPGKNLMVVMTVMGQQARDIYKNQKGIRDQVAEAAGVGANQVLFYNQTTNQDPRTGVTAMSLIVNVDCQDQLECGRAGMKLFNSSSQTRLTDALARNSISMLPGTFQVYGVQQMGKYKGNETLYENKALTTIQPTTTGSDMDYNSTLARVFAGMDQPATTKPTKGKKGEPAGALPGDIPLAGTPGLFGNFSIPMNNMSLPQASFAGMGNATQLQPFGALNELPGLQNVSDAEPAPAHRAKSSAGGFAAAGVLPFMAAAVAVMVL